jgi:hypothetical protein
LTDNGLTAGNLAPSSRPAGAERIFAQFETKANRRGIVENQNAEFVIWELLRGVVGESSHATAMSHKRRESRLRSISMESKMEKLDSVVAVYSDHNAAEDAIKKLAASGFEMKNLSVVGKGYHSEEKVVGFYNTGDRVKFWGSRGAFWGGFWGLFLGGLFMTIPVVGHVMVLGYLATVVAAGIENAVVVGGLSALGAALYSLGIPKNSVLEYETAVKADGFLVLAHGSTDEVARAKSVLAATNPQRIDLQAGANAA